MKRLVTRGLLASCLLVALAPGVSSADSNCRTTTPGSACVDIPVSRPGRDSTEGIPVFVPGAFCGNNVCDGTENYSTCPADCGTHVPPAPVCGDGFCSTPASSWPGNESASTCPSDCPAICGDGACTHNERAGLAGDATPVCVSDCGYQACPGGVTMNWTVSGATCSAQSPAGVGDGQSATLVKSSGSPRGSAVFVCRQGRWNASPESGATCQAVVEGTCNGAYNGATVAPGTISSSSGCSSGAFNWIDPNAVDGTYDWTCSGSGGGGTSTCMANRQINNCSSGGTTWGGSCRGNYGALTHGSSSSVANSASGFTGSATVSCNDGSISTTNTSCAPIPSSCPAGTAAWGACSSPYSGLGHGNTAGLTNQTSGYSGTATATCNNGSITLSGTTCSANAVNGVCGSANGQPYSSAPSSGLCSQGSASSVTAGSSSYTWVCNGSNGGSNQSCSASRVVAPSCGAANGGSFTSAPSSNLCSSGSASSVSQSGNAYAWSCSQNGFPAVSCSASNQPSGCNVYATLVDSTPASSEAWRYHFDGGRPTGAVTQPAVGSYQSAMFIDIRAGDASMYNGTHLSSSADTYGWRRQVTIAHGATVYINSYQRGQHSDYDGDGESGNLNRFVYQLNEVSCTNGAISVNPQSSVISDKFRNCNDTSQNRSADYFINLTSLACDDDDDINNKLNQTQPFKIWQGAGQNRDIVFQRIAVTTPSTSCPAMTMTGKYPGTNSNCYAGFQSLSPGVQAQLSCTMNGATNYYRQLCQAGGVYGAQTLQKDY